MVLTNVLGPALLVRAALPHLTTPGGQIVLVGSVAGRIIRPGSLYGATKAAVASIAENLRPQLTGAGIRVALVEPGITDTPFWGEQGAPAFALESAAVAEAVGWIVGQPAGVDVNELMVRPVGQPI
jgi:NADP-dependent 3-hydroxy acid dehydrogenase YdfG